MSFDWVKNVYQVTMRKAKFLKKFKVVFYRKIYKPIPYLQKYLNQRYIEE